MLGLFDRSDLVEDMSARTPIAVITLSLWKARAPHFGCIAALDDNSASLAHVLEPFSSSLGRQGRRLIGDWEGLDGPDTVGMRRSSVDWHVGTELEGWNGSLNDEVHAFGALSYIRLYLRLR